MTEVAPAEGTVAVDQPDPREGGPQQLERYRRELTGYCYRMLGSSFDAEDAVQDTMVRAWKAWDAVELVGSARERLPLLVDQGEADEFLGTQLKPELLRAACQAAGHPLELRMRPGYDHSYYFVASFIGEHVAHHARALHPL